MDRASVTSSCKLRVLLVTHYFPSHGGGVESVAGQLAGRLADTGAVQITWFSSATDPPPDDARFDLRSVRAWNGLESRFEAPLPIWTPGIVGPLWRAIGSADVVHVHDVIYPGNALACVIAFLRRKPFVVTQHIGPVPYRSRLLRHAVQFANSTVSAALLRRASRAMFISEAVRQYFGQLCHWRGSMELVPNGVDTTLFRLPSSAERVAARRDLGIDSGRPALAYVGRFIDKKGLPLLRHLAARIADATWLFAGWGQSDPEAWGLPNVRVFRDRKREGIRELLWACDLLLLPSESEGFPLVVQEAIACGVPCLVTSAIADGFPPVREMLFLETLGNGCEDRWTARIHALLADSAVQAHAVERAEFARNHWGWQPVIERYLESYRELAAGAAPSD